MTPTSFVSTHDRDGGQQAVRHESSHSGDDAPTRVICRVKPHHLAVARLPFTATVTEWLAQDSLYQHDGDDVRVSALPAAVYWM